MKIYLTDSLSPMEQDNRGRIISVFLRDKRSEIHNYRCNECGKIAFQYSGDISTVYDGAKIPEEKAILDILCSQCKIKYRVGMV